MTEALEDIRNIRQGETNVKKKYRKRLNQVVFRFRNVCDEDEEIKLYIDGLSHTIRMVVTRYHESVQSGQLTFKSLAYFAKSEDETYRAQIRQIARRRLLLNATRTARRPYPGLSCKLRRGSRAPSSTSYRRAAFP